MTTMGVHSISHSYAFFPNNSFEEDISEVHC